MSESATGRVVDKAKRNPIEGIGILLRNASQVHGKRSPIKPEFTGKLGKFSFEYAECQPNPETPGQQVRSLRLTIRLGRMANNLDAWGHAAQVIGNAPTLSRPSRIV